MYMNVYKMSTFSDSPSLALSQLPDTPKITIEDDFLTLTQRKTIDEVKNCKEV